LPAGLAAGQWRVQRPVTAVSRPSA
jgi:hypothetical protein